MPYDRKAYLEEIREKAEQIARQQDFVIPIENASEYRRLVHELNVHQIELEIQNEELLDIQSDLEKTRNRYADLFNNAPVGYVILDRSGFILQSNQTFADMLGLDADLIRDRPLSDFLSVPSRHALLSRYKAFYKNPSDRHIDVETGAATPPRKTIRLYGRKETAAESAEPGRLRIIAADITAQRAAEKALEASHRDLALRHRIAETMLHNDGSEIFDEVLQVLLAHFEAPYGYFGFIDEAGNLVCPSMTQDIYPRCAVDNKSIVFPRAAWGGIWGESLMRQRTVCKESRLELPDGHIQLFNALAVPITYDGGLIGQIVIGNKPDGFGQKDITDIEDVAGWIAPVLGARIERDQQRARRVKAEDDLRQAQRMESIGVLAGGIAHDFNNLLSPIIGYTDMMMEDMTPDECRGYNIAEVSRAAHRAKDLVGQLLAFSRKQMLEVKPLDINTALRGLSNMLTRLIREDIDIRYVLSEENLLVRGDAGQLDQVLLNLVTNAQDAMDGGGEITIDTSGFHIDAPCHRPGFAIPAGDYCRIRVQDTGAGIPETVLPHIFEPFFTTKERGKGTGMGLATCYGIVKQHGGYIWAERNDGSPGSTFTILFPAARAPERASGTSAAATPPLPKPVGPVTIMVVEDESAVRMMAVLALKKQGFTVIETDSPLDCLERVEADGLSFDLLLTDVIMPGCSGKDLYRRLKKTMPELKALYMSGYTDNVISEKGLLKEGIHFIGKPFSIDELKLKVNEVLNDR